MDYKIYLKSNNSSAPHRAEKKLPSRKNYQFSIPKKMSEKTKPKRKKFARRTSVISGPGSDIYSKDPKKLLK